MLFVHGIQERREIFDFLTDSLPVDIAYENLTLPGHGAGVAEFRSCGQKDWLAYVESAARKLGKEHERVVFVGHSLGSLIGIKLRREGIAFSDMLLLCCPLCVRMRARFFKNNLLACLTKGKSDNAYVRTAYEMNAVNAKHPIACLSCVKPYRELFAMIREEGRQLPLPMDARFFFSERDEIVSPKSVMLARERFFCEPRFLPDSGHNCFSQLAKGILVDTLKEMI